MRIWSTQVALAALVVVVGPATALGSGLYEITLTRVEHCEDEGTQEISYDIYKAKRMTGWTVFRGSFNGSVQFDDDIWLQMELYIWNSAGWSKLLEQNLTNVCSNATQILGEYIETYLSQFGIDPPRCPIKPGTYRIANLNATFLQIPIIPVFFYGDYRGTTIAFHKHPPRKIGCINTFSTLSQILTT